jgi:hypothetical protein
VQPTADENARTAGNNAEYALRIACLKPQFGFVVKSAIPMWMADGPPVLPITFLSRGSIVEPNLGGRNPQAGARLWHGAIVAGSLR